MSFEVLFVCLSKKTSITYSFIFYILIFINSCISCQYPYMIVTLIRLGANSCRSCHYPYIKSKLTEKCHLFSKRKPVWILGFLGFFPQTCAIAGGVCLSGPRRDCFGCQGAMYRRRLSNAAIGKPSRPLSYMCINVCEACICDIICPSYWLMP